MEMSNCTWEYRDGAQIKGFGCQFLQKCWLAGRSGTLHRGIKGKHQPSLSLREGLEVPEVQEIEEPRRRQDRWTCLQVSRRRRVKSRERQGK